MKKIHIGRTSSWIEHSNLNTLETGCFPKKQKHDITASKYYGVAVTNASKLVVAKFKGDAPTA